jgi:hypothetical protein
MNHKIKIIKRGELHPKQLGPAQPGRTSSQSTREIARAIKLWVSEFKEKRRGPISPMAESATLR